LGKQISNIEQGISNFQGNTPYSLHAAAAAMPPRLQEEMWTLDKKASRREDSPAGSSGSNALAPQGGSVYGDSAGLGFLVIFFLHFLMDNGVPGCLALTLGNVIFPGPAPQPELFDKVQIRHNATHHNPFLYLKVTRYSCANAALSF
jgi:hypothetical protein